MPIKNNKRISEADELGALQKVLASDEFQGADRLKEFLEYIAREHIEGRGDRILGKNILQDVYGRSAKLDGESANIVRVDAGRLRRRLSAYYANEGKYDKFRIYVDTGGYAPRFELNPENDVDEQHGQITRSDKPSARPLLVGMVGGFFVVAITLAGWALWPSGPEPHAETKILDGDSEQKLARGVLFETDPIACRPKIWRLKHGRCCFQQRNPLGCLLR